MSYGDDRRQQGVCKLRYNRQGEARQSGRAIQLRSLSIQVQQRVAHVADNSLYCLGALEMRRSSFRISTV